MKIIDLLNKIANGEEVPKKVKWKNNIYTYVYDDDREENIINYYCDLERHIHLIDGGQHDIRLNDEVEIIKEEKKIPEKLNLDTDELRGKETPRAIDYLIESKINQVIDYFKSKGE